MKKNMLDKSLSVTYIGLIINLFLFFIKLFVGIFGYSRSLIADGIHSLTDLISDLIVIFGIKISNKPTDENHNYGHKKISDISELFMSIILFLTALGIFLNSSKSIYLQKINHPSILTIYAALLSIIIKEILFFYTYKIGKQNKDHLLIANAWHHRSDSFSSIAVLIGLIIARLHPKLQIIDSYLGLAISFLIIKISYNIFINSFKKLTDSSPGDLYKNQIISLIEEESDIKEYHDIRMRYIGNDIFIDMHILLDKDLSLYNAHSISGKIKQKIKSSLNNINDVLIHIEPYIENIDKE